MKKIFICQSNYIPWRGYFDAINSVDEFIVYDQAQYTKNDWRNRNKIRTAEGELWLTIPVAVKNRLYQKINEVKISNPNWAIKHWKSIENNYSKSPFFKLYSQDFKNLYLNETYTYLTEVNYSFLKLICAILNIKTKITYSLNFPLEGEDKTERIINICKNVNATDYYSGPSAEAYLKKIRFDEENIKLHYFDYSNYKPYSQLHEPFINNLSILDLLFNEGPNSQKYFLGETYSPSLNADDKQK